MALYSVTLDYPLHSNLRKQLQKYTSLLPPLTSSVELDGGRPSSPLLGSSGEKGMQGSSVSQDYRPRYWQKGYCSRLRCASDTANATPKERISDLTKLGETGQMGGFKASSLTDPLPDSLRSAVPMYLDLECYTDT